jgi:hypothetical protein
MKKRIVTIEALVLSVVCLQITAHEEKVGLKTVLHEQNTQQTETSNLHASIKIDDLKDFYTGEIDTKLSQKLKIPTQLISAIGSTVLGGIAYGLTLVTKAACCDTHERYKKGEYCSSCFEGIGTLFVSGIDAIILFSCLFHIRKCITGPGADD